MTTNPQPQPPTPPTPPKPPEPTRTSGHQPLPGEKPPQPKL